MAKKIKRAYQCPKCGSSALWYKDSGDIQCTACMYVVRELSKAEQPEKGGK